MVQTNPCPVIIPHNKHRTSIRGTPALVPFGSQHWEPSTKPDHNKLTDSLEMRKCKGPREPTSFNGEIGGLTAIGYHDGDVDG
jgi:hypothetical protein